MKSPQQKIFLTGATGFIGGALAQSLCTDQNVSLVVLVRKKSNVEMLKKIGATIVVGNLEDPSSYKDFLSGVSVVYHVGGVVTDWAPISLFYKVNTEGTKNLLSLAINDRVERFIYISTIDVLRRSHRGHNVIDENTPYTSTKLPYHRSKLLAEQEVLKSNGINGIKTLAIRPAWVYGPGDRILFPEILKQILSSKIIFLAGRKDSQIPLVYIDNLVKLLVKAKNFNINAAGKAYNIADKETITWKNIFKMVAAYLGVKIKIFFLPQFIANIIGILMEYIFKIFKKKKKPLMTRISVEMVSSSIEVNSQKIMEDFGYGQKVSFNEGFNKTMSWLSSSIVDIKTKIMSL